MSNQSPTETGAGYSIEEAAAAIRLSYVTVYRRVRSGEWPGGQVGRKWLVSCLFIDALAEAISTRPQVNAKAFAAEWMARGDAPASAEAVALCRPSARPRTAEPAGPSTSPTTATPAQARATP